MLITILILLVILCGVSVYANFNMIKQTEILEERVVELEQFIQAFSDNLSSIDNNLTEVDTRGTFEADDEVGYTFKTIKLITSQLQQFNINYAKKKEE